MSPRNRILLISFALLSSTAQLCFGMQLGATNGTAVFGRPLDLSIPVRLESSTEDIANCFSAEVFQADVKFDAGRVRVDVTPSSNGLDAVVRVRSITSVTEPWAKLVLQSNCGTKISRQYELLTDFISDLPSANTQATTAELLNLTNNTPVISAAAANQRTESTQIAQASRETTVNRAAPALPAAPVSNWSVKRAQDKIKAEPKVVAKIEKKIAPPVSANTTLTALAPTGKTTSKLKMETFELTDERQVLLKLSSAMIAPTGTRTPEEIQSLAQATAVWRAINGLPAEATATKKAEPSIEANAAAMAALQAKLQAAQKKEYANPLVYGLGALLALALGSIAWMLLRMRKPAPTDYGWLEEKVDVSGTDESDSHTNMTHNKEADTKAADKPLPYRVKTSQFFQGEQTQLREKQAETTRANQKSHIEPTLDDKAPVNAHLNESSAASSVPSTVAQSHMLTNGPVVVAAQAVNENMGVQEVAKILDDKVFVKTSGKDSEVSTATNTTNTNKSTAKVVVPLDDLHFDERLQDTNTKRPSHDKPITSTSALIDMVTADSAAKLRSVPIPIPPVDIVLERDSKLRTPEGAVIDFDIESITKTVSKPGDKFDKSASKAEKTVEKVAEANKTPPKSDTPTNEPKSNMIDFDIFAEAPDVSQKPTRFNR
jgi:hypothetical protein